MNLAAGRVVSVQFMGGFPAAANRRQVRGLHWEQQLAMQLTVEADGSRRPAVYRRQDQVRAEVVLNLPADVAAGEPATLRGELGGLALQGDLMLAPGPLPVLVTGMLGDAIARHAGDVSWSIQTAALAEPVALINTTRLELFAVLEAPAPFFTEGVWAEVLRLLVDQARLAGEREPQAVMEAITRFCHEDLGLSYDSAKAQNHYGVEHSGGNFSLLKLLDPNARVPLVSCFDLAGAVLVLAGAVGVAARWLRAPFSADRSRFGFILESHLVGIEGNCNNPFFKKTGTPQLIGRLDENRSAFGLHGFCESAERIFDACVGPQVGEDDRDHYLRAVVDAMNRPQLGVPDLDCIEEVLSPIQQLS